MRLFIGLILAALQLSGCESPQPAPKYESTIPPKRIDGRSFMYDHEIGDFYVQQVSCTDKSTPEDRAFFEHYMEHMRDGSVKKLSLDEVLRMTRPLVYKGHGHALWVFGIAKYFFMIRENSYDAEGKRYRGVMPAIEKRDMVVALTYVFIVDGLNILTPAEKQDFPNHVTRNDGSIKIPPAWIAEAKANAAKWRKHCGKQ